MKYLIFLFVSLFLVGCATSERRIPTFKEAVAENPNLESGIYNKSNGENVQVTIVSLKAKIEELEKQLFDARHEKDYYKRQNDELQHENMALRVHGNYELEKQVTNVQGFDANHNAVFNKTTVPVLPPRAPASQQPVQAPSPNEPVSAIEAN
jgi:hypothetical protein